MATFGLNIGEAPYGVPGKMGSIGIARSSESIKTRQRHKSYLKIRLFSPKRGRRICRREPRTRNRSTYALNLFIERSSNLEIKLLLEMISQINLMSLNYASGLVIVACVFGCAAIEALLHSLGDNTPQFMVAGLISSFLFCSSRILCCFPPSIYEVEVEDPMIISTIAFPDKVSLNRLGH